MSLRYNKRQKFDLISTQATKMTLKNNDVQSKMPKAKKIHIFSPRMRVKITIECDTTFLHQSKSKNIFNETSDYDIQ